MSQLPFGLRSDGILIDAFDAARGRACNCVCPECRRPLVARKGTVRIVHFAHADEAECWLGAETGLRMAAEQILLALPWLDVPKHEVVVRYLDQQGTVELRETFHDLKRVDLQGGERRSEPAAHVLLSAAALGNLAVIVRPSARRVDASWLRVAADLQGAIGIDLRAFEGDCPSLQALARFVQEHLGNKHWLRHPLQEEHERTLRRRPKA